MNRKTFAGFMVVGIMSTMLAGSGAAFADQETATATMSMIPNAGSLFKEAPRPVDWEVEVEVIAPPSSPNVLPTKRITAHFPEEMEFSPNPDTEVCPESKIGPPPVRLSVPPEEMIARCPKSLLGNGTGVLRLGQCNTDQCLLTDPVFLIFYGGTNARDDVELRIYAYSRNGATGLYMEGSLRNSVLSVDIPQITGDSSTAIFKLGIPGSDSEFPDRHGVDPGFVKATCATGLWVGYADLTLGNRDTSGQASGPESLVRTPDFVSECVGADGKARFARPKIKGPATAEAGRRRTYRVSVKNTGTATAETGKISVSGRGVYGKATFGSLAPGASRTIGVKVRFSKSGKVKAKFRAGFQGLGTKVATKRIKVT